VPGVHTPWTLNVAVTLRAELNVTLHVAPLVESQPVQPAKLEPDDADAVSTNEVPATAVSEQSLPQLMPFPVTLPEPVPDLLTVSV
jgi:hypothetical protein